jgi:hypothetical protein
MNEGRDRVCEDCARDNSRRKLYGIGTEDYAQMLAEQWNACAICRAPYTTEKRLVIDHDHETGKVRGLLCSACNKGLGNFRDSREHLQAAISYLARFVSES